ncbi:hypothetical protein [Catenulispora yoronensis]
MSYAYALELLGEKENRIVAFLGKVAGGALLATGGIDLLEARTEVVELGNRVLRSLGERLRGTNRVTRRERIYAAHAVVVVTAFFEALDAVGDRLGIVPVPGLNAQQQMVLVMGGTTTELNQESFVKHLARTDLVTPYVIDESPIVDFYAALAESIAAHLTGLAAWDHLDETEQERLITLVRTEVPELATAEYEAQLRSLAGVSTEFRVWLTFRGQREVLDGVLSGLAGLEDLLTSVRDAVGPDSHNALTRAYRAALEKPIAPSGQDDDDIRIPSLADGYIDHRFRFTYCSGVVGSEEWWREQPVSDDLVRVLAGHLVSPKAFSCPLLILGQPGSGKSVLTKVLAARLPQEGFLPVRVELRQVDADADLQDQIEAAIRLTTSETVKWPRFVDAAPDAVPVVLLDGFDELLQATGVTRTDFLHNVVRFQEREADQGRPVAVVVTSRTAVADRASLPGTTPVLRLEPFDEDQVAAWLRVWNAINGDTFAVRTWRPIPSDCVLRYPELAEQPLLLLMLALYDVATENGLASLTSLDPIDVYERLFHEFCRRELSKSGDTSDMSARIELELERLAIVAFAMFNRRSQWAAEAELTEDLLALKLDSAPSSRGLRAPLSAGEQAVGKFFFIHNTMATQGTRISRTYEFLHSTFSEFLIARHVAKELVRMTSGASRRTVDDAMLHALLSFECLASRDAVVSFLWMLLGRESTNQRAVIAEALVILHADALMERTETIYAAYTPRRADVVERHAAWSANLVLLATLAGGELRATRLFGDGKDAIEEWRRHAALWRAMLSSGGWDGLVDSLDTFREWSGRRRDITLKPATRGFVLDAPDPDLRWTFDIPPGDAALPGDMHSARYSAERKAHFTAGVIDDVLSHDLRPLRDRVGDSSGYFSLDSELKTESRMLLEALLVLDRRAAGKAYENLVTVLLATDMRGRLVMVEPYYLVTALAALLVGAELQNLPSEQVGRLTASADFERSLLSDHRLLPLLNRIRELT